MVNIRNYEVSIWTLQDSFITVLKQSNLENKGKIQDPQMVLKDDGDNTFSFKIPMYLQEDTDLAEKPYFKNESMWKENPIWYTVRNGNLIASLRKIKVIFNKGTVDEEVFEFIINNIKESHEGYEKYCEVECGGLAFHELGKQGYEIVLSQEEFIADYKAWEINQEGDAPINRINYWIDKVLNNSNWTYIIDMDWSQYDGIINKNDRIGNSNVRQSDKIYREPYISSWELDSNDELIATSNVTDISKLEKLAYVEAKESNRYNLLQSIAEAFQVFCKFKYLYDDNYHIIGRQVIFYNNFINESEGVIDFNYGYNTSQITREMDGTDLVSKMYVKALSNSGTIAGEVYLSDSAANPTLDNFLLNFNYLYKIGTISQEQYNSIKVFQKELYILNSELKPLNNDLIKYNKQIEAEKVKKKTADDLYTQAGQRVASAEAELVAITSGSYPAGNKYTTSNPCHFTVISDSQNTSKAYVKLNKAFSRLHPSTLVLYKELKADNTVNTNSSIPTSKITFKKDSDGFINKITFPKDQILISNNTYLDTLYATFEFDPNVPSQTIINIWNLKQGQAKEDSDAADEALNSEGNGLYALVKNCEEQIKIKNAARKELIKSFERLMGPALREGTWQPEDDYADYQVTSFLTLNNGLPLNSITTSNEDASFIWDEELFYGEQKLSYGFGVNNTLYYPYIELTIKQWNNLHNLANLNLIYRDIYLTGYDSLHPMTDEKVNHYLQVGASSGCQFAFIKKSNGEIKPVLLVLGVEELLDATVNGSTYTPKQQIDAGSPRLRVISTTTDGIVEDTTSGIASVTLKQSNANDKIVYPRFKVKADRYLENYPDNKIYQNKTALKNSENYYELYRDGYYYVTIKNPKLSKPYSFHYAMSTAAEAVYLDAIEILRENSVPKVSYTMAPLAIEQTFVKNAYARLGQLAHINDQELKFENVQGYISEVDLNLDKPWEDNYIIKNYKTKFEDLFSTIVAQTEAMKKNSQLFSMVSNAFNTNGLLEDAIVDNIKDRLNLYIPTPAEVYAQYEEQIRDDLRQAFNDAGKVLAAAQNSVNDVSSLNVANATILGSFVENIKENMTPTTFNGSSRSKADFKVGDIWNNNDNVYLATENSKQLYPNGYPSNILTSLKGWSLVKDGSLAQIKGASFDLDSENGIIQFEAETIIKAKSGGDIALQANNNILIQANNTVDINGAQINLNSLSNTNPPRGILIQAVNNYNNKTASSKIDIKSSGIEMMTAGGISMAGAGGINIYTSNNAFSGTSAISINKDTGIYIGSGKSIILYSGEVPADASNSNYSSKGASVLIDKDRILFGVSDTTTTGTAIDLTKERIVIGAGADINGSNIENIGSSATGIKITKEAIDFAAGNNNLRSYLHLAKDQILISNTSSSSTGAQVSISQSGVVIGTASKATNSSETGFIDKINSGEYITDPNTATFQVYAPNFVVDAQGKLYAYGAYIAGDIRASSLTINGKSSDKYVEDTIDNSISSGAIKTFVESVENDLQSQIDGEIDTWFYNVDPTTSNEPAKNWTNNTLKQRHLGDLYYNNKTGQAYRWSLDNNTYKWIAITDSGVVKALADAAKAQATADGKITTYYGTGTPTKTDAADGDLYINSTDNEIYRFNISTKTWVSIRDKAFMKIADFVVDPVAGTIKGSALKQTINGKTTISGTTMELDANGNLKFASLAGIEEVAKLTMNNSGEIILNSSKGTIGNSNLKLTPTSVSITSGGAFNVDSTNFYINATSENTNFRLGPSAAPDLSYTIGTGLSVKGEIKANSGYIGGNQGWSIYSNYIQNCSVNSAIKLGDISTSGTEDGEEGTINIKLWQGELSGKYLYLYKTDPKSSDANFSRMFIVNSNKESQGESNNIVYRNRNGDAEDVPLGTFIYNIPFHWLYNFYSSSWLYYPEVRFGYNSMYLNYYAAHKDNDSNYTSNWIYLHQTDNFNLQIKSEQDSIDIIAEDGDITLSGNRLFLSGTTMINDHRLIFNPSSVPSKVSSESDIYWFKDSSSSLSTSGWTEVKIYRKIV